MRRPFDMLLIVVLAAATFAVVSTALASIGPEPQIAPPALTCAK